MLYNKKRRKLELEKRQDSRFSNVPTGFAKQLRTDPRSDTPQNGELFGRVIRLIEGRRNMVLVSIKGTKREAYFKPEEGALCAGERVKVHLKSVAVFPEVEKIMKAIVNVETVIKDFPLIMERKLKSMG